MNDTIPRIPGIVDNNMDLPVPKIRCRLHQPLEVVIVRDIARDKDRSTGQGIVDSFASRFCLRCSKQSN